MATRGSEHLTGRCGAKDPAGEAVGADFSRRDFLKIAALAGGTAVMGKVRSTGNRQLTAPSARFGKGSFPASAAGPLTLCNAPAVLQSL